MVGGPWLTTAAGVGSPMFPSPLAVEDVVALGWGEGLWESGTQDGLGAVAADAAPTQRHGARLDGGGGSGSGMGGAASAWASTLGSGETAWGLPGGVGEGWAGLSTEDLLLAMSAAPVLASPQPATFTATGGCAPVTGHTHVYRGGAEGVGLAPGACVDVDVGNGGVRGGAGGRVASPVDVSGDGIKRIGVDDSCGAVTLDAGTLAPTGLRVQGGCGADTDALEGTRAVDQMHARVRAYVDGSPGKLQLEAQPLVTCPRCSSKVGVPGSFTNALDVRSRCARCAWVWCDNVPEPLMGEEPVSLADDAVVMTLLWGRCVDWGGQRWLQVVHADTVLGVVCLRLALAIRELVAEGPAFGRSEVAVMWAIVAWCRHWVMPSNERATWFLAEAPWCVDHGPPGGPAFVWQGWGGPAAARPCGEDGRAGLGPMELAAGRDESGPRAAPNCGEERDTVPEKCWAGTCDPTVREAGDGDVSEWESYLDSVELPGLDSADWEDDVPINYEVADVLGVGVPLKRHRGDAGPSVGAELLGPASNGWGVAASGAANVSQLRSQGHADSLDIDRGCAPGQLRRGVHQGVLGVDDCMGEVWASLGPVRWAGGAARAATPHQPSPGDLPSQGVATGSPDGRHAGELRGEGGRPESVANTEVPRVGAWHARTRAMKRRQQREVARLPLRVVLLVGDRAKEWTPQHVSQLAGKGSGTWSPWPTIWSYPGVVWDTTVGRGVVEQACEDVPWSPDTPVCVDSARVRSPSTLRADLIWQLLEGHPHRAFIAGGALWGFGMQARLPPQHMVFGGGSESLVGPQLALVDDTVAGLLGSGKAVCVDDCMEAMLALVITPIVVAPKVGAVGRVCHDLSAGQSAGVNASMDTTPVEPVYLLQPGDVVTVARYLEEVEPLEKVVAYRLDLKAYFSQLPWRVRDAWLTGQRHRGRTFIHRFATYGGSSVPGVASIVSNAVCDILARRNIFVRVFLDDFVGVTVMSRVWEEIAALREVLATFGLLENMTKFIGPGPDVEILGVRFQFGVCSATVTQARSARLQATVEGILGKRTVEGQVLKALCGSLSFVSAVVPWGRAHVSPLWAALARMRHRNQHCAVTVDVRRSLMWWLTFLQGRRFNVAPFNVGVVPSRPLRVVMGLRSDASTRWGMGAVSGAHGLFLRTQWTKAELLLGIVVLEGLALVFLLVCLGPHVSGMLTVLQSDNAGMVFALLKEHSRDPRVRVLLQAIVDLQEFYRFYVVLGHTSTLEMGGPDGLSHGDEPSACLPWRQGGWSECLIPVRVRSASCDACESLLQASNRGDVVAAQEWVSSISGLLHMLGGSVESYRWVPVPFVPFRRWEVVINESVLNPSQL